MEETVTKRRWLFTALSCALLVVVATLAFVGAAEARKGAQDLPVVGAEELPQEARDTLVLIKQGGPFPYTRDGLVKGLRDLPQAHKGA